MQKWQLIIFLRNTDIIISINGQEKIKKNFLYKELQQKV